MARQLGSTDAEITAVHAGEFTAFEAAWAVALAVGDEMTRGNGHLESDAYARLAAHWTPPQIVEIISVAATFALYNRFANALEIPPTK